MSCQSLPIFFVGDPVGAIHTTKIIEAWYGGSSSIACIPLVAGK